MIIRQSYLLGSCRVGQVNKVLDKLTACDSDWGFSGLGLEVR